MRPPATSALVSLVLAVADACMRVTPVTPGMPATACKSCSPIKILPPGNGNIAFNPTPVRDDTGACSTEKFVCVGPVATIDFGHGGIYDGLVGYDPDPTPNQVSVHNVLWKTIAHSSHKVTVVATCEAGSKWNVKLADNMDYDVKDPGISCALGQPKKGKFFALSCATCAPLPLYGQGTPSYVAFEADNLGTNGDGCLTRTVTCVANLPSIVLGKDDLAVPDDGTADGDIPGDNMITLTVTCNPTGDGWKFMNFDVPVTTIGCSKFV